MRDAIDGGTSLEDPERLELDLLAYLETADFDVPDEVAFQALAGRVFRHQFLRNEPYQRFCRTRGVTPDTFQHHSQAPAVPTDVFKAVDLATFPPSETIRTFQTSGTTRGLARGHHRFSSMRPYESAILPVFQRFMLPDGVWMPLFGLVPAPDEMLDSSLSYMVGYLIDRLAVPGSRFFFRGGDLDLDGLIRAIDAAVASHQPVMMLGTAFAFVHLFDERPDWSVRMPPGSRVMETGGFKGKVRDVPRAELYELFRTRLGLPDYACVAEYGMTELSSQLYDGCLRDQVQGQPPRRLLRAPPWLKIDLVDPVSLQPLPEGQVGLIRFFDLANLNSVSAIQTSDRGRWVDGGLELLGRAPDAEARGCSLTAEELLRMSAGRGYGER